MKRSQRGNAMPKAIETPLGLEPRPKPTQGGSPTSLQNAGGPVMAVLSDAKVSKNAEHLQT